MKLRDYQIRAVNDLWDWFTRNRDLKLNPIVEACVGAGKSLIIAAVCKRAVYEYPGVRILVVMHQKELAEQNIDKFQRLWPGQKSGVWSAALRRKEVADVTFATIGSVYKDAALLGRIDIILADECHLINPKEAGMWRRLIRDLRMLGSDTRVVGFTGTPFRGNGVWLTEGKEALFTHIISRVQMRELLDKGYLVPLIPAQAPLLIDSQGVGSQGGDFVVSELRQRADVPVIVQAAAREIVRLGADRRRWLVFCVDIEHARHVAAELQALDVAAAAVHDELPTRERDTIIKAFKSGQITCLVNVAILTTGFDAPEVDFIALLRPTRSPLLYVQIMGRGMRLLGQNIDESIANGKANCLVADFTSTIATLGPVDAIKGRPEPKKGKGQAVLKTCLNCGSQCAGGATQCPECGWEFPPSENDPHGEVASGAAVLSDQLGAPSSIKDQPVTHMSYRLNQKEGGKPYLMAQYFYGPKRVATETIHFELDGIPRRRAVAWWHQRTAMSNTPNTAQHALHEIQSRKARGLVREPSLIRLDTAGKYPNVVHATFPDEQAIAARENA